MMNSENRNWTSEFESFMKSESISVPQELNLKVLAAVGSLLNPNAYRIFAKILGFHLISGILSLSICHQFGLNPFQTKSSLADWFMTIGGHNICMIGCGILFVGLSIAAAGSFLTIEEVRVLRKTSPLQISALSIFSLGAFAAFGAQFALAIAGLWILGGLIGGMLATEIAWQLKRV